jgi:hypothetical protein
VKNLLPVLAIITLVLVLVVAVATGAFYFGQKTKVGELTPEPTVTEAFPSDIPTPTSSSIQGKTITAGGVLVFSKYTLILPNDWQSDHQKEEGSDKLILTKEDYTITIAQVASEGVRCIYGNEPEAEFTQKYTYFVEITNPNGFIFRRSSSENPTTGWTVCQKGTDGSFMFPTNFGYTSITTPSNPTTETMSEIDSILASIKKS